MNKIVISEKQKDAITVDTVFDTGVPLIKVIDMILTAILPILNNVVQQTLPAHRPQIKAMLYDLTNQKMSALLETFAPEIEMRPSLTAEALLKAENEVLAAKMPKM